MADIQISRSRSSYQTKKVDMLPAPAKKGDIVYLKTDEYLYSKTED